MPQMAVYRIEPVPVEAVRPLRMKILRAGLPPSAAIYPGDDDPATRHYAARNEAGEVIAIASSRPENRAAGRLPLLTPGHRLRGIAVDVPYRRRGLGRALVERGFADATERGALEVWINVREPAVSFGRAVGLVQVSEFFDMPDLGPHVVMARAL